MDYYDYRGEFSQKAMKGYIIKNDKNKTLPEVAKEEGKKYDKGKPMAGSVLSVFPEALMAIGACIEFGTHKYPNPNNWKMVEGAEKRYLESLARHLLKHLSGQEFDSETKLPHIYHAGWNMLAILELYLMRNKEKVNKLFE